MSDKTEEIRYVRDWGERLETFRPHDSGGTDISNEAWAKEIGISSNDLGRYLGGNQQPRLYAQKKITDWIRAAGYSQDELNWLWDGGPHPPRSRLRLSSKERGGRAGCAHSQERHRVRPILTSTIPQ